MPDSRALILISRVLNCSTQEQLFETLVSAARSLGFDNALYGIRVGISGGEPIQHVASAYPAAYQRIYLERDFILRDPTVRHALTSSQPLVWRESMYSAASRDIMEESRSHGLAFGLSVPMHDGAQVRGMLSLARDKPFENTNEQEALEAGAQVLASAVHMATTRIVIPELVARERPKLTGRELECLRWVAQGKSTFAISRILAISESAVKFHIQNVLTKLKVSTRQQAVAIGVVLGLIT